MLLFGHHFSICVLLFCSSVGRTSIRDGRLKYPSHSALLSCALGSSLFLKGNMLVVCLRKIFHHHLLTGHSTLRKPLEMSRLQKQTPECQVSIQVSPLQTSASPLAGHISPKSVAQCSLHSAAGWSLEPLRQLRRLLRGCPEGCTPGPATAPG